MSIFETYKKFAKKLPPASLKPVVRLDPKLAGPKILPFNEKPRVIGIIGSPVIGTAKSKEQKKEEKQMKEVYDKVILNGGKKKTAEEKIMDQVINGK